MLYGDHTCEPVPFAISHLDDCEAVCSMGFLYFPALWAPFFALVLRPPVPPRRLACLTAGFFTRLSE